MHEVALRQRVAVVAGRGVDPADPRATVEWRVGGQAHGLLTKDNGAQPLERILPNAKEWPSVVEAAPPLRCEPFPRAPLSLKGV